MFSVQTFAGAIGEETETASRMKDELKTIDLQLRFIRVRSGIGHTQHASARVLQLRIAFVSKRFIPNRSSTVTGAGRIATLDLR